jgi:hypothetical protein
LAINLAAKGPNSCRKIYPARRKSVAKSQPQMPSGDNSAQTVAEALNAVLADSFALYFKNKNFHWHVSGPHFHDYHQLFDAQAMASSTVDISKRLNPPQSEAFHQASRKSAALRHWPVSP